MLEPRQLIGLDSLRLVGIYDDWPSFCNEAYDANISLELPSTINQIIFTGMGGSGASGELISQTFQDELPSMKVIKGYHLPKNLKRETLVIASSVSGNTQETISTMIDALKYDAKLIAISSGGLMQEFCRKNGMHHVRIKMLSCARASLPFLIFTKLRILRQLMNGADLDHKVLSCLSDLKRLSRKIGSSNPYKTNWAKQFASWLIGITPCCYCSPILKPVASRFKSSLSENAKVHAVIDDILEMAHNSIEAWVTEQWGFKPILLPSIVDDRDIDYRFRLVEEFLTAQSYDVYKIPKIGSSLLANMICLTYILDYSSIYLAMLRKIDPGRTPAIDFAKNKL